MTCGDASPRAALIGDVRPHEVGRVLFLQLNLFVLMAGYYVLKTVREPLVLLAGGAELRAYASLGQAVLLVAFIPAFGWLASRVDRLRLLTVCLAFFAVCIEMFHFGLLARVPGLGFAFFVWVGIFNLAAISLFWSYANDLCRPEEGARLFPVIAVGAVRGPVGSRMAERRLQWVASRPCFIGQASPSSCTCALPLIERDPRVVPKPTSEQRSPPRWSGSAPSRLAAVRGVWWRELRQDDRRLHRGPRGQDEAEAEARLERTSPGSVSRRVLRRHFFWSTSRPPIR